MQKLILEKLKEIEAEGDVRILFACESGSRAWGFPSPDSDYDVRIIYSRPTEWYLTLYEGRDVLGYPIDGDLDIEGWDIRKTLALVHKSNVVVWEWLQSPIVYAQVEGFQTALLELARDYFSPKTAFHHYLSMVHKGCEAFKDEEKVKLKKLFYIIRPLLAARWIAEGRGIPPMELESLMEGGYVTGPQKERIAELVNTKSQLDETYLMERDPAIEELIEEHKSVCESAAESVVNQKGPVRPLDEFFQKVLKEWK